MTDRIPKSRYVPPKVVRHATSEGDKKISQRGAVSAKVDECRESILHCVFTHDGVTVADILSEVDLPDTNRYRVAVRNLLNDHYNVEVGTKDSGRHPHRIRENVYFRLGSRE